MKALNTLTIDATKTWSFVEERKTDKAGRVSDFLELGKNDHGIYRLTFLTRPYFKISNTEIFNAFVQVVFKINDGNHYHVPIILSAFGYFTYIGN